MMPGGVLFGLAFFLLLFLAALTSAISILESCTAFLNEELHWSRLKSTLLLAAPDESAEHRVFAVAERGAFAEFAMAGLEARAAMAADECGHGKVHR